MICAVYVDEEFSNLSSGTIYVMLIGASFISCTGRGWTKKLKSI